MQRHIMSRTHMAKEMFYTVMNVYCIGNHL